MTMTMMWFFHGSFYWRFRCKTILFDITNYIFRYKRNLSAAEYEANLKKIYTITTVQVNNDPFNLPYHPVTC